MIEPRHVYCVKIPGYASLDHWSKPNQSEEQYAMVEDALQRLIASSGLDTTSSKTGLWNPFGKLISSSDKVVVNPNWVNHENQSGFGLDCLITHPSLIEAVLRMIARTSPSSILLGDAPIQGCDFNKLLEYGSIADVVSSLKRDGVNINISDFRKFIRKNAGVSVEGTNRGVYKDRQYVTFDLGRDSLLEPISQNSEKFRVTMYDPRVIGKNHLPGVHRYLIAKEVLESDVFFNLPKLKTHKKAGITGAIKNVVGINCLKDYLPHHQKGGGSDGGDCYEGSSIVKAFTEEMLDGINRAKGKYAVKMFSFGAKIGYAMAGFASVDNNFEGSWYGNDTVWRMALDLQRILHYGRADGTLSTEKQRTVVSITDGIIAGEGEGPLASSPNHLGILTFGMNVCALEWVHALLMQIDPNKVPIIARTFDRFAYPLAEFEPAEIIIHFEGEQISHQDLTTKHSRSFIVPDGWKGHCELETSRNDT